MNRVLPDIIHRSVTDAREAMQAHPYHLLLPFYRHAIYQSINDVLDTPQAHKVKTSLSIFAAQHVLPLWNIPLFMIREDEEDYDYWLYLPHQLVNKAVKVMRGELLDEEAVQKEAEHLNEVNGLTGQTDDSPYYHEWCVFDAALNSLTEVLPLGLGNSLETDKRITISTTDEDVNCCTDTAILACLAYAGGEWSPTNPEMWVFDKGQNRWLTDNSNWYFEEYGVWDRNKEQATARRKHFWEWWLSNAIHEAWHQK